MAAAVALGVAGVSYAGLACAGTAAAEPSPSARPKHVWAPEDMSPPARFRVVDLRLRTVELRSVSQDAGGAAVVKEDTQRLDVTLNSNVLFDKDSDVIRPEAAARLQEVAQGIKQRGPGKLSIVGYTDDLGSAEHGLDLSRRRAAAVNRMLAPALPGVTITTDGKGEADPVAPNDSEENRAKNRRVEMHYTKA